MLQKKIKFRFLNYWLWLSLLFSHIIWFFYFIDHKEMLKCKVGRIMTKLAHRHSLWTSYRASYPTLLIYDEIWLLSWMHRDLWRNLWRNWHNVMVFGLHIGLHIQHCESVTKSDSSSWMQCDEIWKRHVNIVMDHKVFCSVSISRGRNKEDSEPPSLATQMLALAKPPSMSRGVTVWGRRR
jgi:hypothetical protein